MNEAIIPGSTAVEFATKERCTITELSNGDHDPGLSIARARVPAGVTTAWHRLQGIAERYVILAGAGVVEVGELPKHRVTSGDVVIIPPDCRQRITAQGTEDLVFLAICTPRFHVEAYEDVEG